MALSWAEKSKRGKRTPATKSTSTLTIRHNHKPAQTSQSSENNKPQIPRYVIDEQEPASDDDIIMYGNLDNDEDEHKPEEPVPLIPDEQFVINHFDVAVKQIFFQLIVKYLDRDDAVRFFRCYRKYAKMFRGDKQKQGMLYMWKYLYHRDYGKIRFQKRRRCKLTQQEQRQKHQQLLQDAAYWKTQYDYRDRAKFVLRLNGNARYGWTLTFYRSMQNVRLIAENDMIIVTTEKCKPTELLDYDRFVCSNWYDVDDENLWTWRRTGYGYSRYHFTSRVHSKVIDDSDRHGFRDLGVDDLMQNIEISRLGIRAFVYPVCYLKLTCYLIEILPFKMSDGLDQMERTMEKRKCTLLRVPAKGAQAGGGSGELMVGLILRRIVTVEELESKMLDFLQRGERLKVCVYAMGFGYNMLEMQDLHKDWLDLKYVVVDYYGDD
eukprot:CAMPEP_0197021456 /NCGR_PEP_ID=MMETSP1384-20130603/2338_1 /TAXON_ID=29189 /ORGANISM="Ammonia sp." /LENGTH=433 /DNA_ID=CAMNT_0042449283 /DNA_START=23 /DNA_END=1324 /DNA_ORIENTATION=+